MGGRPGQQACQAGPVRLPRGRLRRAGRGFVHREKCRIRPGQPADPIGTVRRAAAARSYPAVPARDGHAAQDEPRERSLRVLGVRITRELEKALTEQQDETIINLASNEYSKAVDAQALGARVVTPTFKDKKDGKYRFLTFYGKRARGQMARYLIQRQLKRPDSLKKSYGVDGYRFNGELSSETEWVFTRDEP